MCIMLPTSDLELRLQYAADLSRAGIEAKSRFDADGFAALPSLWLSIQFDYWLPAAQELSRPLYLWHRAQS